MIICRPLTLGDLRAEEEAVLGASVREQKWGHSARGGGGSQLQAECPHVLSACLSGTAVYSPNAKPTNSIQWQRSIRK